MRWWSCRKSRATGARHAAFVFGRPAMASKTCAYRDDRCAGRVFATERGTREHLTCPKGYAAYLAGQPKSWSAKVKAEKAARAAFEANKAKRSLPKAAEPVKPIRDNEALATKLAAAILAVLNES